MRLLLVTLLIACMPFLLYAEDIHGVVVSVHDGDTYTMQADDGTFVKVRQQAIDAPELKQPYGKESAEFSSLLLLDRKIILHVDKKDLYGRTLGRTDVVIGTDTLDVERLMIRYGYAWHYQQYDKDEDLDNVQQDAKENKRGLWQDSGAIAPWVFRHERKK